MKQSVFIRRSVFYLLPVLFTFFFSLCGWDILITEGFLSFLILKNEYILMVFYAVAGIFWTIGILLVFFQYRKIHWSTKLIHILVLFPFFSYYPLSAVCHGILDPERQNALYHGLHNLLSFYETSIMFTPFFTTFLFDGFYIRDYVRWYKKEKSNLT